MLVLNRRATPDEVEALMDACHHVDWEAHKEDPEAECWQWRIWATDVAVLDRLVAYRRATKAHYFNDED